MKIECFPECRQGETEGIRMEEGKGVQGTRTPIKDVEIIGLRTREDLYG